MYIEYMHSRNKSSIIHMSHIYQEMYHGNIIRFLDARFDDSRCLSVYIDPGLNLTLIQPITGDMIHFWIYTRAFHRLNGGGKDFHTCTGHSRIIHRDSEPLLTHKWISPISFTLITSSARQVSSPSFSSNGDVAISRISEGN